MALGTYSNKIPIYPIFYLLKGDCKQFHRSSQGTHRSPPRFLGSRWKAISPRCATFEVWCEEVRVEIADFGSMAQI